MLGWCKSTPLGLWRMFSFCLKNNFFWLAFSPRYSGSVPGFMARLEVQRFIFLLWIFICVFPLLFKLYCVHEYLMSIIHQLTSIISQTQLCLMMPGGLCLWVWFLGSRWQIQPRLKSSSSSLTRWKCQADHKVLELACKAWNKAPEEAGTHSSQQDLRL